jgi:sulfur-carrier protein
MAMVHFTSNLRRHVDCPSSEAPGTTVAEVLAQVFRGNERLAAYVLDEQGALRKHMTILVDGRRIGDRVKLSDGVSPESQIYVLQALSGG